MNFARACTTLLIGPSDRLTLSDKRKSRGTKEAIIESAYRESSILHHSDESKNDPDAKARWKEVVEAKEFLLRDLERESTINER